jgi:sortase B
MNGLEEGTQERKSVGRRRALLVLIVVCAAVFAFSAYKLITYYWTAHEAERSFDELRLPDGAASDAPFPSEDRYADRQAHYRKLHERNGDFAGWLRIFDTDVDYPVMQTPDERDYYLHRDFDRKYSAAGTLFASDISDIEKPSDVIIIFGHMMKSGAMFGGLKEYTDESYMTEHRIVRFDTLEEERLYRVFLVFVEAVNTGKPGEFRYYDASDFADESGFDEFMKKAKAKELYDTGETAAYGDEILALSTCEYTHDDGRLVLLAKRFYPDENGDSNGA